MTSTSGKRQARRQVLTGLAALGLALGGCSLIPRGGSDRRPPAAPGEPERAESGTNNVALLVPLTGENGGVGTSIANAARLALVDSGAETVKLTVYDTAAAGAAQAAQAALRDDNRLILGPLLADDVRLVAPIARAADIPVVAFSNDSSVAGDGVFIMGVTPAQSIERIVAYASAVGLKRVAGLIPAGLYGQRSSQALLSAVPKAGGRVTALESYERSPAALRAAVRSVRAKGQFDAVLIADTTRAAAIAAPLIKQGASARARILGTELWGTDRAIGANAALRGAWFAAVPDANFQRLVTRYRGRYGKIPYRLGSLGYDAMLLAVRSARNWRPGSRFPARQLVSREGFAGVDGIFRFGRDGIAERSLEVRQVTAAGSAILAPSASKFAD